MAVGLTAKDHSPRAPENGLTAKDQFPRASETSPALEAQGIGLFFSDGFPKLIFSSSFSDLVFLGSKLGTHFMILGKVVGPFFGLF